MIFLTVGSQFPFDRLVRAVDEAFESGQLNGEMYGQIGETSYQPRNFRAVPYMEKQAFDDCIQKASAIISHAGMGTISMALDRNKPLLVMPRLKRHGEAVNDHQMAIVRKFEELGHMLVAYDADELPEKIRRLKTFVVTKRAARPEAVAQRIAEFLGGLVGRGGGR